MSLTTLAVILYLSVLSLSLPQCQDTRYGRSCQLPSQPTRTVTTRDGILVGATNALYSFNEYLTLRSSADLTPPDNVVQTCKLFHPGVDECLNYVKVITPVPMSLPFHAGEVLVCGTNARLPKCNFFNVDDLTKLFPLSNDTNSDAGYCPFQPPKTVVSLVASNGHYLSGTTFNEVTNQGSIGMARNALYGDKTFITTSVTIQTWINNGDPAFISIYELKGYVYFFLTEQAAETSNAQIYSRVVRVCINDTTVSTYGFRTFQKARIVCTNSPDQSSLSYSYNELKATVLLNGTLYGAFSSAANGPKGAAICKFPFDSPLPGSIPSAFGTGKYLVSPSSGTNWQQQTEPPFSCPGTSRTQEQIANNILVLDPIQSLSPTPLFQVLGTAFTAIAADSFLSFGSAYEVLYYALEGGGIEQLVITRGSSYRSPLTAATSNRYETRELVFRKVNDNVQRLYATTTVSIEMYTLGNCSLYANCLTCLESKDPYCVWSTSAKVCVNRVGIGYAEDLIEGFALNTTTVSGICGVETTTTPTAVATTPGPITVCSNFTPPAIGVEQQKSVASSVSAGVAAGAAIGGFSVGIPVGVALCAVAMVIKRFVSVDGVFNSRGDGAIEEGGCKSGTTTEKPDNNNKNPCSAIKGACMEDAPTHGTVDVGYQGNTNVHQNGSQESADDDDVIVELGALSGAHVSSTNKLRTESTRWLTKSGSNESTDQEPSPT